MGVKSLTYVEVEELVYGISSFVTPVVIRSWESFGGLPGHPGGPTTFRQHRQHRDRLHLIQLPDGINLASTVRTQLPVPEQEDGGVGSNQCHHDRGRDFKTVFLRHFSSSRKYQKTDHCLFALKQGSAEPLRSYIKRFNQVAQDVSSATSEILMSAFYHGLAEGEFFRDLIRDPVKNFDSMLERAASYINVEEAQAVRRKADRTPAAVNKPERRTPQQSAQPLPRAREVRPLFQLGQEIRPAPQVSAVHASQLGPWNSRYCTYHRSRTHDINHCFQFARDSRRAAELGLPPPELAPQILKMMEEQRAAAGSGGRPHPDPAGSNAQQPGRVGEPGEDREAKNRSNAVVREIAMISGGPTNGDSGRARKCHVHRLEVHTVGCRQEQAVSPFISFGPQDLEGLELPHDDALIIKAIIANS
ncbi:uncharacterized protein LOC121979467 [Zingiber officinale]|uniref:uncharacterized protein LOC121979467 n=1 Tax=Zingiber officinale TaxID=94328 RepID=UPI001C4D1705|nr:uncharacterized protein LOC121979467 [Zingiber officinale]